MSILLVPKKNICRTCLKEVINYKPLITKMKNDDRALSEILSFVIGVDISVCDKFPKQICYECHDLLCKAYGFKKRCIESESLLKSEILGMSAELTVKRIKKHEIFIDIERASLPNSSPFPDHMSQEPIFNNDDTKDIKSTLLDVNLMVNTDYSLCSTSEDFKDTVSHLIKKEDDDGVTEDNSFIYEQKFEVPEFQDQNKDDNNVSTKNLICSLQDINCSLDILNTPHVKEKNEKPKKYQCSKCMRQFVRKVSLIEHIKRHDEQAAVKFTCKICKREFKHQAHLDNHIQSVHLIDKQKNKALPESEVEEKNDMKPDKKYQCNICNKTFGMNSTLIEHLRTHTGEKPYLCSICGRGFSQKNNMLQHMRRHQGLKPFKCEHCDRRFVSKGELDAHTRKHSGAHPFVCDNCGSSFTTSSSLTKHRRIHTGEKRYACEYCSMRFTALGTLKNHVRTHTGEKPYQCSYCEKAFVQKQDLTSHIRCHTGERPYVCKFCGQGFRKSAALKVHVKIHSKDGNHAM